MSAAEHSLRIPPPLNKRWIWALGYVFVFLLLDWVSYIRPFQGLNITPWNPQPALAIALLLWRPRWLWLVWTGLLMAELVVRGMPADWLVTLAATAALTLCFAAIARAIEMRMDRSLALSTQRDLVWFSANAVGGALVSGSVYVSTLTVAGLGPTGPVVPAIARYWIGDAVGLMVMLPMLLMLMDQRRSASLLATLFSWQWWVIAALIALLMWAIFGGEDHDYFKFFYLLLLPVVWASTRLGLPGAVLAASFTQIGLIVAVQSFHFQDLSVFELQVLMAAITMTGLALGVAVDEQARAEAKLKGSLRLAAAGQMAAALAHELNQPLTALNSYAEASAFLATSPNVPDRERLSRLIDVSQRMAGDARRASDVVRRLREFFRTGSTQLQTVAPMRLLNEVIDGQRQRADALRVDVQTDIAADLIPVLVDPVQIAVVLRNLLENALEASSAAPGRKAVVIRARRQDEWLAIEVEDSGPGVAEDRLPTLWEPGPSDKAGGMGIGLSICRAIVEAHGGRLTAEAGVRGRFCLALPIDRRVGAGASRAP
jgi:signal transduction histidine kinase